METPVEMFVTPKVFRIGETAIDHEGLTCYLQSTGQIAFLDAVNEALRQGITPGEILCSFYSKLCYASLVPNRNNNITKIRDIDDNIAATLSSGHGSVFEHCWLNFVATDVSRVFTHELVRHRAGTAFSQTSGRYVRVDHLKVVMDPLLLTHENPEVQARLTKLFLHIEEEYHRLEMLTGIRPLNTGDSPNPVALSFDEKKKLTSALRRVLPQGIANEIGFSINLRALRHTIMLRTSRHAEWEIRYVFNEVYRLVAQKYVGLFADASVEDVDGLLEITGMRMQPYDIVAPQE